MRPNSWCARAHPLRSRPPGRRRRASAERPSGSGSRARAPATARGAARVLGRRARAAGIDARRVDSPGGLDDARHAMELFGFDDVSFRDALREGWCSKPSAARRGRLDLDPQAVRGLGARAVRRCNWDEATAQVGVWGRPVRRLCVHHLVRTIASCSSTPRCPRIGGTSSDDHHEQALLIGTEAAGFTSGEVARLASVALHGATTRSRAQPFGAGDRDVAGCSCWPHPPLATASTGRVSAADSVRSSDGEDGIVEVGGCATRPRAGGAGAAACGAARGCASRWWAQIGPRRFQLRRFRRNRRVPGQEMPGSGSWAARASAPSLGGGSVLRAELWTIAFFVWPQLGRMVLRLVDSKVGSRGFTGTWALPRGRRCSPRFARTC